MRVNRERKWRLSKTRRALYLSIRGIEVLGNAISYAVVFVWRVIVATVRGVGRVLGVTFLIAAALSVWPKTPAKSALAVIGLLPVAQLMS
mgnify:CR=1 FL=1